VMRPGAAPMAALASRLAAADIPDLGRHLAEPQRLGELLRRASTERSLLLVVDQLEELLTLTRDEAEREQFVATITAIARDPEDPVRVVVTLRDDFLVRIEALPGLRDRLAQGLQLLGMPSREDLERILVEPARRVGYRFEDHELVERMLDEVVDQPGALALLSFTASRMWDHRDRHFRRLPRTAYQAFGGVGGALAHHAETLLGELTRDDQRLVREAFRHLVTGEGTRAVLTRSELSSVLGGGAAASGVIERLVASRLLVASEGEVDEQIEIAHEALLDAWPRLVEWRRADAEGARLRDQLRAAARQWDARGRPQGLLWRGEALAEYRIWRRRVGGNLTPVEEAFATAGDRAERRFVRRRRMLVGGALAIAVIVAIVFFGLTRRAQRATREARERLIESHIENARTSLEAGKSWDALRSLTEIRRMGVEGGAYDVMRGIARESVRAMQFRIAANEGATLNVAFSPDDTLLATAGQDGAALWDARTGRLHAALREHRGAVDGIAFSPDRGVTTAGSDGTIRFWSRDGTPRGVIETETPAREIAWRSDGRYLASRHDFVRIAIWDPVTHTLLFDHQAASRVRMVTFGARLLAAATVGGEVIVIDPEVPEVKLTLQVCPRLRSVTFDSRGSRLAAACVEGILQIVDLEAGLVSKQLLGATDELVHAEFSPDDRDVIAAGLNGTVRVWDAATGRVRFALAGHRGTVWTAKFDPRGERIVTSGDDLVRVWDRSTGMLLAVLDGHTNAVFDVTFSSDGSRFATSSFDGSVVMWSARPSYLEAYWPSRQHGGETKLTTCTAGHRHASYAAAACPDETRIWELTQRRLLRLPGSDHVAIGDGVAWTTDGAIVRKWDLRSGQAMSSHELPEPVTALAAHGTMVIAGGARGGAYVYDRPGSMPRALPRHAGPVTVVALLPSGQRITIDREELRVYSPEHRRDALFEGFPHAYDLEVDPEGHRAIVLESEGSEVIVLELDTVPRLVRLRGHKAPIINARFEPGGQRMVTTSSDGTSIRWDLVTRAPLLRFANSPYLADAALVGDMLVALDGLGHVVYYDANTARRLGKTHGTNRPTRRLWLLEGSAASLGMQGDLAIVRVPNDPTTVEQIDHELVCAAPGTRCP
jgi:WD40 repeat protein